MMNTETVPSLANPQKERLETIVGYTFKNPSLLVRAVTHLSHANEKQRDGTQSYETLEFLGDAVLQMFISDLLVKKFTSFNEGQLSRFRSHLVSEENLSGIARHLELGQFILLGKGEENSGGKEKRSILADVVEAIIGAVYTDNSIQCGLEHVKALIERWFLPSVERLENYRIVKNSRSILSELVEKNKWEGLEFRCTGESGRDHEKIYTIEVWTNGVAYGKGVAGNKKQASKIAAENTLIMWGYDVR